MTAQISETSYADPRLDGSLHGLFLRGLALSADRECFRVDGHGTTYAEAHRAALALAGAVADACGGAPRTVAVLGSKSGGAYTGLLAALYLGARAVPLHPDFPAARNRAVLEASRTDAVIADERGVAAYEAIGRPDLPLVAAEQPLSGEPLKEPRAVRPEDTAYILFTSGSTGRPKGVPTTHRAADSYFRTLRGRYDFGLGDAFTQTFDLTFDCAMFDLFCAWGAGARVVPLPMRAYRALPEFLAEERITVWFSTPAAIALARRSGALAPGALDGLRWSLFAGEPLHRHDAEDWRAAAPHSTVENLYGPTELTVTVTAHRLSQATPDERYLGGVVPIGPVHASLDHVLLAPDGSTDGDEGELCITGPQMFDGYLDPAENEGRFLDHDGRRWYRTGDRVRRWPDGEIGYLGRADDQVQVQGWRVELSEVGHAVRALDGVEDAVAVAVPRAGSHELVAFYTGRPTESPLLARELIAELPRAMVPRLLVHLAEFPMNANRKIDRSALRSRALTLLDSGRARS
ncbi:AMP-binding protein [Streptomyces sp. L2]|uniref:AMP-binding protein n=1 Tax=Streptomyces sp. L2 TaxID=2162665 RepID=UPI0010126A0C|nr:AMP-binding protein [Streptomyces sp. L2]